MTSSSDPERDASSTDEVLDGAVESAAIAAQTLSREAGREAQSNPAELANGPVSGVQAGHFEDGAGAAADAEGDEDPDERSDDSDLLLDDAAAEEQTAGEQAPAAVMAGAAAPSATTPAGGSEPQGPAALEPQPVTVDAPTEAPSEAAGVIGSAAAASPDAAGSGALSSEPVASPEVPAAPVAAVPPAAPSAPAHQALSPSPEPEPEPDGVAAASGNALVGAAAPALGTAADTARVEASAEHEEEPHERTTLPDSIAAKRREEPLPSFDIPELEASAKPQPPPAAATTTPPRPWVPPAATTLSAPSRELGQAVRPVTPPDPTGAVRAAKPPSVPPPSPAASAAPPDLGSLNALREDEEDAVTSIEVSASEISDMPSAPSSFEVAAGGFAPADAPPATAMGGFVPLPATAQLNPRRAATVVIRRIEPVPQQSVAAAKRASSELVARMSGLLSRRRLPKFDAGSGRTALRRAVRFVDSILPELSLVLFGTGLGAGIGAGATLLALDSGAEVAQAQAIAPLRSSERPAREGEDPLLESARRGDAEALARIDELPREQRTAALTLALEEGEGVQSRQRFRELVASLATNASASDQELAQLVEFTGHPATMIDALEELARLPGPKGPDLLYTVWERAPGGSRAASLARSLLQGEDQRGKASAALKAVLELKDGKRCEDYASALPAVLANGDERSLDTLESLRHTEDCGADQRQDCFPCLRKDSLLTDAIEAVKARPAPRY